MKKIIGIIRPFQIEQTFMVYEDGNKIDIIKTTLENLHPSLFELIEKYQIGQLDLVGPKKYLKGVANQIQKAKEKETKYNLVEDLEINII